MNDVRPRQRRHHAVKKENLVTRKRLLNPEFEYTRRRKTLTRKILLIHSFMKTNVAIFEMEKKLQSLENITSNSSRNFSPRREVSQC